MHWDPVHGGLTEGFDQDIARSYVGDASAGIFSGSQRRWFTAPAVLFSVTVAAVPFSTFQRCS